MTSPEKQIEGLVTLDHGQPVPLHKINLEGLRTVDPHFRALFDQLHLDVTIRENAPTVHPMGGCSDWPGHENIY